MTKPDKPGAPAKPDAASEHVSIVEIEAVDLDEWERDQRTPSASPENLAALVRQTTAKAPDADKPAPPRTAATVTRAPTATLATAKPREPARPVQIPPKTESRAMPRVPSPASSVVPPRRDSASAVVAPKREATPAPVAIPRRDATPLPTAPAIPKRDATPVPTPKRATPPPIAAVNPPVPPPNAVPVMPPSPFSLSGAVWPPMPAANEKTDIAAPLVPPPLPPTAPTVTGPLVPPESIPELPPPLTSTAASDASAFGLPPQIEYPTAPKSWTNPMRAVPDATPSQAPADPVPRAGERRASTAHVHTPNRKKLLVAGGAGALIIVAVAISIAARGGSNDTPPPPKPAAPQLAAVAPAPAPEPAPVTTAPPAPVPPPAPVEADASDTTPKPPPAPHRPATLGGKPVVVEYDNSATHHAEAAAPTRAEDEAAVGKARAMYNEGNQRLFAGDANGAVQAYRGALDAFPGYVAGYRGLGLAYMELGNNPEAVKALQTYVRAAPTAKDVALVKKRIAHLDHP